MSDNRVEGFVGKWGSRTREDNVFLLYNGEETHGDNNLGGFWFKDASQSYSNYNVSGVSRIPKNKWIHIVGVWRNTDGYTAIYKNGIVDNFTYNTDSIANVLHYHTSYNAAIGNWGYNHGSNYNMIGSIDEVRIYNRALNDNEIRALYLLQE